MKRAWSAFFAAAFFLATLPNAAWAATVQPLMDAGTRAELAGLKLDAALQAETQALLAGAKLGAEARTALSALELGNAGLLEQRAGDERIDVYHHYDEPASHGPMSPLGWIIALGLIGLIVWSFTIPQN